MDGVGLLQRARAAGLDVRAEDDRLLIRGPKRAEKLALELLTHKAEVIILLQAPAQPLAVDRFGWAIAPKFPCAKGGNGLCYLRLTGSPAFVCIFQPKLCEYLSDGRPHPDWSALLKLEPK